jgi:putative transposase
MSSKYKFADDSKLYFISFSVVYWIDLFTRTDYCKVLLDSFTYCEKNKGMELYAYCIMPSHVHLILGSNNEPLADIMRDFKSFTSRSLRKAITGDESESRKEWMLWMMKRAGAKSSHHRDFQLWQEGNHPVELTTPGIARQKLEYLHNNPVAVGLVHQPEHWRYSSASNYMGQHSERDVIILDALYG